MLGETSIKSVSSLKFWSQNFGRFTNISYLHALTYAHLQFQVHFVNYPDNSHYDKLFLTQYVLH